METGTQPTKVQSEDSLLAIAAAGDDVQELRAALATRTEAPSEELVQNLLTTAATNRHLNLLDFLFTQYPSVPLDEDTALAAINTGSIPVFKTVLAHHPSIVTMPFEKRGSPLAVACMGRQTAEFLEFLLEAGADPNQDPDAVHPPLALVAALYEDPAVLDLLLRHGARVEHSSALAAAAQMGKETMILHLFRLGARLETDDAPCRGGSTPLHVAVRAGRLGAVRVLLEHGADPDAPDEDEDGVTARDAAKSMGENGKDAAEMLEVLETRRRQ